MNQDYRLIPGLEYLYKQIDPASDEAPVHAFGENLLKLEFPLTEGWLHKTKCRVDSLEPDSQVMRVQVCQGQTMVFDAFTVELKRPKGQAKEKHFKKVAEEQLDRCMVASKNPAGSTLLGAVWIGYHIKFYYKQLHNGPVLSLHEDMFHIWEDAPKVREWLQYIKNQAVEFAKEQAAASTNPPRPWSDWYWQPAHNVFERYRDNGEDGNDFEYKDNL